MMPLSRSPMQPPCDAQGRFLPVETKTDVPHQQEDSEDYDDVPDVEPVSKEEFNMLRNELRNDMQDLREMVRMLFRQQGPMQQAPSKDAIPVPVYHKSEGLQCQLSDARLRQHTPSRTPSCHRKHRNSAMQRNPR